MITNYIKISLKYISLLTYKQICGSCLDNIKEYEFNLNERSCFIKIGSGMNSNELQGAFF